MSSYEDRILPPMIRLACGNKAIARQREMVVPEAEGRVLEVGMGPGLNIPFYDPDKVEMVWGLEPNTGMRKQAQQNLDAARFPVEWLDLPGEQIPLEDNSADTVLLTYTLCTIPDWRLALEGMRRVLRELWVLSHFEDTFSKGLIDSFHLVFYLGLTVFFLFLAVRSLEARKWR